MIRTRTTRASRAMVLALLASAAAASVARADTYTWNGKGDTPNWDDPFISPDIGYANWVPFGPHLPGSGDDVIFGTGFVSGTGTIATPIEVNLNGTGSSNTSNPNGISTVNINPGDTLEPRFLSLFQSNAVVNVNAGSLVIDENINGDPGTTINLQADPAGGHALVLNTFAGVSSSNITGAGSLILTGNSPTGFIGSIRVVLPTTGRSLAP